MIQLQDVPRAYTYCFGRRDNALSVPRFARHCARLLEQSEDPQPQTLHTVNACYVDRLPDAPPVPFYCPDTPGTLCPGNDAPVRRSSARSWPPSCAPA